MKNKIALARNLTLNAFASYVETGLGLVSGVIIARSLGPHDYGIYAFSVWMCGMIIYACNSSLTTSSIKFVAEATGKESDAVAAAIAYWFKRAQMIWSGVCMLCFCIGVMLVMPEEWKDYGWWTPVVAIFAIWSRANFRMLATLGEGYEIFEPENYVVVIAAIINVTGIIILSFIATSFKPFFVLYMSIGMLMAILVRRFIRKMNVRIEKGPIPLDFMVRIRKHVLITGVFVMLGLLSGRFFEMMFLKIHWGVVLVGYFAIASMLTRGAIELLASGITAVLMPAMAKHYGMGGKASLARVFTESMRIYWFVGLLLTGIALIVTGDMVKLLYGRQYVDAIPIILVSMVVTGLTCFGTASATVLTASDHQRDRVYIALVSLLINAGVAWALVPRYGLLGAGICIAVVRIFDTVATHFYAVYRLDMKMQWGPLLRMSMAGIVAALVSVPIPVLSDWNFAFIPAAPLFLVVYLGATLVFRVWRADDIEFAIWIATRLTPGQHWLHGRMSKFGANYARRVG